MIDIRGCSKGCLCKRDIWSQIVFSLCSFHPFQSIRGLWYQQWHHLSSGLKLAVSEGLSESVSSNQNLKVDLSQVCRLDLIQYKDSYLHYLSLDRSEANTSNIDKDWCQLLHLQSWTRFPFLTDKKSQASSTSLTSNKQGILTKECTRTSLRTRGVN